MSVTIGDRGMTPSFQQQGTIDWVQLANTGVTATVSILSRLSAANVDPFTLTVAQTIAGQYKLSREGKLRLSECLNSLMYFPSLENAIWFGFGVKHLVRILAQTTQGMSTIALCGGLSEVMSSETVASILDNLPEIYGAPQELRPSLLQWEALVSSCSGVISSSTFGLIAEQFMKFAGDGPVTPNFLHNEEPLHQSRECGDPSDVASALNALGKVSSGSLLAIELRGGAVCGLIAALGFWFLGLSVEIRRDNNLAYRSSILGEPVHILVTYSGTNESENSQALQVASRTYYIRDISSILGESRFVEEYEANHMISGKVPWDEAVGMTFGKVGKELLKTRYHFGKILGNTARLFHAVATSEENNLDINSPKSSQPTFGHTTIAHECGYGKGLIHFSKVRLPELDTLDRDIMEDCLSNSIEQAHEELEAAFDRLAILCGCFVCSKSYDSHYKTYCMPTLAESLVVFLRNMALVHLDVDLSPYRSGLEQYYRIYEMSPKREQFRIHKMIEHTTMGFVHETTGIIFTGRTDSKQVRQPYHKVPSAYTVNGLTFYSSILLDISDRPERAATLHIVPGCLSLESGRVYAKAEDLPPSGWMQYKATNYQPISSFDSLGGTSSTGVTAKLSVQEEVKQLNVTFNFAKAGAQLLSLGPMDLLARLSGTSFSVYCPGRRCPILKSPLASCFTVDGEGTVDQVADVDAGRLVVVRRLQGDTLARCIALGQNARHRLFCTLDDNNVILKADECWSCCIKEALRRSNKGGPSPVTYIL